MAACWLAEFSCIAWPWVKPTTEECSCDRGLLGCIHQAVLRGTWADVASNEKFFMEPLENTALQMKNLTVARYNLAKFPALVNMLCPSSPNPGRHALRFRNTHWHGHAQQFGEVGNQSRPNLIFFFPSSVSVARSMRICVRATATDSSGTSGGKLFSMVANGCRPTT